MKLIAFPIFAALAAGAFAQLPNSKILTVDVAQTIAQEAMAKCRADGYKVAMLVVRRTPSGTPKAMLRDDGATASGRGGSGEDEAATATMLYNHPSGPATPLSMLAPHVPQSTIPGITINAQGSVPIKVGDAYSSARLRVSGAPGNEKDCCSKEYGFGKGADELR